MSAAVGKDAMRLIEDCSGVGELSAGDRVLSGVRYEVRRFQAMTPSGMPVPGLHRIEGRVEIEALPERAALVHADCTLRLEDGRTLRLTMIDADGRVLAEGHGPTRCLCC